jgi:hypothetical protein
MPISPIVLQRRHAELGRIRLGDQQPTASGKTRPNKLSKFRFTSVSEQYIRDLATLYGGEARPWDNNGIASWEVYSEASSIPVIVVKGGLSQFLEHWSGGGCQRRCTGERELIKDQACICDPQDRLCKPTTRLSMMLPELEAIGVFRMETHGWNSAAEIPAVAELAQFVGDLVPANLHLVERRSIKDGQTYDADVVEDADADQVWNQILSAAGTKHGWTLAQVQDDFTERMQGMLPSDATAGELRVYLEKLQADEETPAVAS